VYTASSTDTPLYYIFNHNNGFVIVSADTRFNTILGYSDSGCFNEDLIPENMKNWLSGYSDEITHYLKLLPETPRQTGILRASSNRTPIQPLIATKWNQDNPYNLLCPIDRYGGRSVTGCVATAYAQIMKFHEWPRNPVGSNGGVDFSGTFFNWRNMLDEYIPGQYNSSQATAVATLMRQCGAAVDMSYSSWASGAYSYDVQVALPKYFKYAPDLKMLWKDYIPQKEWASIIYDELSAGRPVYYSGSSAQGGHAFVCDGYSENEYFHFNWGWGGYEDGYYLLSALNPAAGGAGSYEGGYNSNQSIIINIRPGSDSADPTQIALVSNGGFFHSSGNNYEIQGSGSDVNLIYNPLGYPIDVQIGLKIESVGNDMDPSYDICGAPITLDTLYGFMSLTSAPLPVLPDGEYRITPVFRSPGVIDEWQPVDIPIGMQNYVALSVAGGNQTLTNPGPDKNTVAHLIFGSPEFTTHIYGGLPIAMRIPVVNVGKGDFSGNLGITLTNKDDEFANVGSSYEYYSIPSETSRNIDITFYDTLVPGTYSLSIMDINGTEYADDVTVTVTGADIMAPSGDVTVSGISPSFITSGRPSPLNLTVNNSALTSTELNAAFEVLTSDFSVIRRLPVRLSLNVPGNSTDRHVVSPFDFELQPGEYFIRAVDNNGNPISLPTPLIVNSPVLSKGDVSYIITSQADRKAVIVAPEGEAYTGGITVPSTVDGYTVTALRNNAFTFSDARWVRLPSTISSLQPGTFYNDTNLNQLFIHSSAIIPYKEDIFNPDCESNIWLELPDNIANQWMAAPGWNSFRSPAWYISTENGAVIDTGLDINPATDSAWNPYYVNFASPLHLKLSAPEGNNIRVVVVLNGEWLQNEVIDPSTTSLDLPAPGYFSTGRLSLTATSENVFVDTPEVLPEKISVYSIDGRVLARDVDSQFIRTLQPGLYIVSGKKILIK
ncbi:MAG: C10 family peptidase, partial [Muribaculaceae bacterium]|nr:C10 family peptidase [Muribaculaceae bacterium]